jgi:hypothetical protein
MNPKPLLALNHFTVPCSFNAVSLFYLSYLMLLNCPQPYNKKGRKSELAAPYANLKVIQEQQTHSQTTLFPCKKPAISFCTEQHGGVIYCNSLFLINLADSACRIGLPAAGLTEADSRSLFLTSSSIVSRHNTSRSLVDANVRRRLEIFCLLDSYLASDNHDTGRRVKK